MHRPSKEALEFFRTARFGPACPACSPEDYEVLHDESVFVARCPHCQRVGPPAESVYEAVTGWQSLNGAKTRSMSEMTVAIAMFFIIAVVISLIADRLFG